MRLSDLIQEMQSDVMSDRTMGDAELRGLTSDSRRVEAGYLFAALPGASIDGRQFIEDAIDQGACAVLAATGTTPISASREVVLLTADNPQRAFAKMAAQYFGRQPERVAAVTGTNGKSSVADFTRQIWIACGRAAASLGTLGIRSPHRNETGSLTTPEPEVLHRELRDLAADGVSHLILEASSHGLDQYRLDGVEISLGAFTNFTRDHLDYHGDMQTYLAAKLALFDRVMAPGGTAVVNADDPSADAVVETAERHGHRLVRFGQNGTEISLRNRQPVAGGQHLSLSIFGEPAEVTLPLIGDFQASNVLCALGLAIAESENVAGPLAALAHLKGVPGRLDHVATTSGGAAVYVDYAHTPDALTTVIKAIEPHTSGRLIVVFGCGGDRDIGKRELMGVAASVADIAIVTDDNPRSEDAAVIRRQVLAACPEGREIADRRAAITAALDMASLGDSVLVAGKGHEQGQIIGNETIPFDDTAVVRELVLGVGA